MRKYETIFISNSDLQEKKQKELFEKAQNVITQQGGVVINFDEWGNKKLAYEIKKKSHGFYVCMAYGGDGKVVDELERIFRLDDNIMKFMTILKKEIVDLDEELAKSANKTKTETKEEAEPKTKEEAKTEIETQAETE
ncbi:MAG: 30S ribosomal protein S6 [Desulfobacterales bacterium]|nr:30S ribosomal protein S6 [Desulfobacterales bacterium]